MRGTRASSMAAQVTEIIAVADPDVTTPERTRRAHVKLIVSPAMVRAVVITVRRIITAMTGQSVRMPRRLLPTGENDGFSRYDCCFIRQGGAGREEARK